MALRQLTLQNFRNYQKETYPFSSGNTIIVGENTAGKTNLLDAIFLLSTGKSFVAQQDEELLRFNEEFARIKGDVQDAENNEEGTGASLEILITAQSPTHRAGKRFFVNGVAKRRIDFTTHLPTLLFTPMDLDLISKSPSLRRNFLDQVLEQVDQEYKRSLSVYMKGLRQRNALLEFAREQGVRNESQFHYWDEILILHGSYIHKKRQEFLDYANAWQKDIISCSFVYDHSVISPERLEKYKQAETAAGMTIVGPHRDDMWVFLEKPEEKNQTQRREVKLFASRGQQRLVVLQMKLLQLQYMLQHLRQRPLLLLDDIFSELDSSHIELVWNMVGNQQTIITTTHAEFITHNKQKEINMIELKKKKEL